jgi:hypothetical protein
MTSANRQSDVEESDYYCVVLAYDTLDKSLSFTLLG